MLLDEWLKIGSNFMTDVVCDNSKNSFFFSSNDTLSS